MLRDGDDPYYYYYYYYYEEGGRNGCRHIGCDNRGGDLWTAATRTRGRARQKTKRKVSVVGVWQSMSRFVCEFFFVKNNNENKFGLGGKMARIEEG